jgi:hypothetical protein
MTLYTKLIKPLKDTVGVEMEKKEAGKIQAE